MKLYVIPKGIKVCLGNGDGKLKIFKTTQEFNFSDFVCDPIYYYNNRLSEGLIRELDQDPTIKAKCRTVAKYALDSLMDDIDYGYKYLYVNYFEGVKVLC